MRINKLYLSLIIYLFIVGSLNAQDKGNIKLNRDSLLNTITDIDKRLKDVSVKDTSMGFSAPIKIDTAYANRLDVNFIPQRNKDGLLIVDNDWAPFSDNVTFRDTVIFDPSFLPVIFDGNIISSDIDFMPKKTLDNVDEFHLISPESTFKPQLDRIKHVQDMRRYYYTNNPGRINMNVFNFADSKILQETAVVEKKNVFQEFITADDAVSIVRPEVEKIQIKQLNWLITGEHKLQLTYNTYSDQWGGDNNFDLFSHQKFNINYKKNKIKLDNLIEWRFQLKQITSVDKDKPENENKDKINVIDDYLRTYSVFKIEAYKRWSYSANLEMKTPIFPKKTTDPARSWQKDFLSPFELNVGIGMNYTKEITSKKDKYRKFNISADLSPLSINYKYIKNGSVPVTNFGIEEGKKSQTDFGSTFNINMSYSHNRFTKYTSRLKYFTNYEKAYAEWENTFDFAINRFFTTTLYFYLKFDDSVAPEKKNRDKTWAYFNYNQMVRFGLTYTW